jgi:hypothetical protein
VIKPGLVGSRSACSAEEARYGAITRLNTSTVSAVEIAVVSAIVTTMRNLPDRLRPAVRFGTPVTGAAPGARCATSVAIDGSGGAWLKVGGTEGSGVCGFGLGGSVSGPEPLAADLRRISDNPELGRVVGGAASAAVGATGSCGSGRGGATAASLASTFSNRCRRRFNALRSGSLAWLIVAPLHRRPLERLRPAQEIRLAAMPCNPLRWQLQFDWQGTECTVARQHSTCGCCNRVLGELGECALGYYFAYCSARCIW